MSRIIVTTQDVVGRRMAGPGIRAFHLARELGRVFPTTLIARLEEFDATGEPFTAIDRDDAASRRALLESRIVIGQPSRETLALSRRGRKFVFDLFDPVVLELAELYGKDATLRQRFHANSEWARLRMALSRGDALVCATAQQRHFYAGVHASSGGRLDGWIDRWITVPFGVEERDPLSEGAGGEPTKPGSPLAIWGGGRWAWLDPGAAIEAVRRVNRSGVACRLLFLGGVRPNQRRVVAGADPEVEKLISRSAEFVEANSEWIPYAERDRWLRSGRLAIMLHRRTAEAEYSIRTRLFDAIWCGLPVVASAGGFAAELVEREGIGIVTRPGDPEDVAGAIARLVTDDAFHAQCVQNCARLRPQFAWKVVTSPLIEAVQRLVDASA